MYRTQSVPLQIHDSMHFVSISKRGERNLQLSQSVNRIRALIWLKMKKVSKTHYYVQGKVLHHVMPPAFLLAVAEGKF